MAASSAESEARERAEAARADAEAAKAGAASRRTGRGRRRNPTEGGVARGIAFLGRGPAFGGVDLWGYLDERRQGALRSRLTLETRPAESRR